VRQIMVLIATASTDSTSDLVWLDEFNLSQHDNIDDSNKEQIRAQHEQKFYEKQVAPSAMKFSLSLPRHCECHSVRFSPNGKYFAIAGKSCIYQIYDRDSMQRIHERATMDTEDAVILQKRRPAARLDDDENEASDRSDDDEYFVTCLAWVNDHSLAVGNAKGNFIYISTVLHDHKIRNFILKEWLQNVEDKTQKMCNDEEQTEQCCMMSLENIVENVHAFIGCDVVDNVIETNFGQRASCIAAHPYFAMKTVDDANGSEPSNKSPLPSTPVYGYRGYHKKEGLFVSGSWSCVFQGCVLKG